jgi:hypothetical protein
VCTKPLVAAAAGLLFSAASNFASALSKFHVIVFQLLMVFINEMITHNPVYSATSQHTFLHE